MARSEPDEFRVDIDLDHARREGDRVRDMLAALRRRDGYLRCDPEELVHLDWSDEWRP